MAAVLLDMQATKKMNDQFKPVSYSELNSQQQESYNFHKIAACLADYGFNCIPLNDDWLGADFIASHINGKTFLKVQQKSRFVVDKKYCGKDLYIAFRHGDDIYLYPHDLMMAKLVEGGTAKGRLVDTASWKKGGFSWITHQADEGTGLRQELPVRAR